MIGKTPGSPLCGRYLVKNPIANTLLRGVDGLLCQWKRLYGAPPVTIPKAIRRILLCNPAHLGDVVLSTAVLPVLRHAFPEAQIGFLTASWSQEILQDHPDISYLHALDHWKLNRSTASLFSKIQRYRSMCRDALHAVERIGYDVAIDLYPFYPNTSFFLAATKIPVRVGYTSGGLGPLFTHALDWEDDDRALAHHQFDLLRYLGIKEALRHMLAVTLPQPPKEVLEGVAARHIGFGIRPYIVVHMGSSSAVKEWPKDRWRLLVQQLLDAGYEIAFTGRGLREKQQIEEVAHNLPRCYVLCDALSWSELLAVISGAVTLYGVDSLAGHLAAAMGTPAVSLFTGMNNAALWRPFSPYNHLVTHATPCAPCHRNQGCSTMECIREIPVSNIPLPDALKVRKHAL